MRQRCVTGNARASASSRSLALLWATAALIALVVAALVPPLLPLPCCTNSFPAPLRFLLLNDFGGPLTSSWGRLLAGALVAATLLPLWLTNHSPWLCCAYALAAYWATAAALSLGLSLAVLVERPQEPGSFKEALLVVSWYSTLWLTPVLAGIWLRFSAAQARAAPSGSMEVEATRAIAIAALPAVSLGWFVLFVADELPQTTALPFLLAPTRVALCGTLGGGCLLAGLVVRLHANNGQPNPLGSDR